MQLAYTGTAGLGSLAGSLLNIGYNIYAGNRDYEADRADAAWSQKMQEQQRQDTTGDSKQSHRSRRIRMNGFDMPEEDLTEEEAEELLEAHGASVEFTA